ncbi:G-protein coupled receptor 4-like [Anabas testudineus]|uniref:G-protein coupled receptor 4-like n=1 Tax=Anabas testudineus TaxID=64144 RepID=UPI000E45B035|nr:G-protein coupled receptor 4-like [Anabas testudineus]XP_026209623.1 G-protein coupled receptor 4-like [Anabas testudineus]XP_026209624.1 G-protein coupled receptor 4-like [Anabas testudineus]XP_026209625.1 G-protein coupled receptor 4-like [Anabas testudineus]
MEDFNHHNMTMDNFSNYDHGSYYESHSFPYPDRTEYIFTIVTELIISISLAFNGAAIYATCSQVPKDNTARIYFINLLISDLIQLYSMTALLMFQRFGIIFIFIYIFGVMVSVGFMVCITLDRYLVITRLRCSCIRQSNSNLWSGLFCGLVCSSMHYHPCLSSH